MEEDEDKLVSFLQWAGEIGISDFPIGGGNFFRCLGNSLAVYNFPEAGGRGFAATRVLRKGELILRVPKAALMTSDALICNDQRLFSALEKYPSLSPSQKLGVCLLNEVNKGKRSWWYPYLKQLPRSYDLLANFNPSEIKALQIDHAIWTAERAVLRCTMEWEEATPLLSELSLNSRFLTFKAWLWASSTICSRTVHIPWDAAGCLCPVGDFFNYVPPDELLECSKYSGASAVEFPFRKEMDVNMESLTDAGYDEATVSYCFYANRNYEKGDQVLLSYGAYTNLELLEHYGFILQENTVDKAYIPLEPEILSLCPWPRESLYISQNGEPSFTLLSTLRLWATPASQRRSVKGLTYSGNLLSDHNEAAVFEAVIKNCREVLSSCSTSINEDEILLRQNYTHEDSVPGESAAFLESRSLFRKDVPGQLHSGDCCKSASYRWKLAVQWRHRYKKILHDCISQYTRSCQKA